MGRSSGFTFKQFHIDHDRCAMKVGAKDADAYLAEWRKAPPYEVEGEAEEVAKTEAARLDATYDTARLKALIESEGRAVS